MRIEFNAAKSLSLCRSLNATDGTCTESQALDQLTGCRASIWIECAQEYQINELVRCSLQVARRVTTENSDYYWIQWNTGEEVEGDRLLSHTGQFSLFRIATTRINAEYLTANVPARISTLVLDSNHFVALINLPQFNIIQIVYVDDFRMCRGCISDFRILWRGSLYIVRSRRHFEYYTTTPFNNSQKRWVKS